MSTVSLVVVSGMIIISVLLSLFVIMTSREKKREPMKIKIGRDSHIDYFIEDK